MIPSRSRLAESKQVGIELQRKKDDEVTGCLILGIPQDGPRVCGEKMQCIVATPCIRPLHDRIAGVRFEDSQAEHAQSFPPGHGTY
jgi:hypothetical protein